MGVAAYVHPGQPKENTKDTKGTKAETLDLWLRAALSQPFFFFVAFVFFVPSFDNGVLKGVADFKRAHCNKERED